MSKTNNTNEICVCGNPKTPNALGCHDCVKALLHDIATRMTTPWGQPQIDLENYTVEKVVSVFSSTFTKMGSESVGTCCICGERYVFGGYNPHSIDDADDARCCALCDSRIDQTARRKKLQEDLRLNR